MRTNAFDRVLVGAGALFVALLVMLAFFGSTGCAGVAVKVEGCYLDPVYGELCVTAERTPAGIVNVGIKTNVQLPESVRSRVLKWGEKLLDQEPARPAE